jgi:molecular chaperone GrpE (heat shock protein)
MELEKIVAEQETQLERQAIQIESLEAEIKNLKKRLDAEVIRNIRRPRPSRLVKIL